MRLIKILVIILFVMGAIYLSLNYFFQKNQRTTYNNLLADLNQLSNLSSSKQEPINKNCQKVMGYMFESEKSNNYKLVEWCSNGYFIFKNVSLNKNIISINPLFQTTTFKIGGNATNLTDNNRIILKRNLLGKDYEVTITANGEVLGNDDK